MRPGEIQSKVREKFSLFYLVPPALVILSGYLLGIKLTALVLLVLADLVLLRLLLMTNINFIGLELGSLAVIVSGIWFGPVAGVITGFFLVAARALTGIAGFFLFWKLPGFMLMGAVAGLVNINLFPEGLILLGGIRLLFLASTFVFARSQLGISIPYVLTNIFIHFQFFQNISPYV